MNTATRFVVLALMTVAFVVAVLGGLYFVGTVDMKCQQSGGHLVDDSISGQTECVQAVK